MKHIFTTLLIFTLLTSPFTLQSHAATIQLPQTGQSGCYEAQYPTNCTIPGQDGQLKVGVSWPSPRFTTNIDQTVTDNLTGLAWTKDANLMKTRDPLIYGTTTYDAVGVPTTVPGNTWQQALDYVKKLNTENYSGHNDWRLPNINELSSVDNKNKYGGDKTSWLIEQGFTNIQSQYWSGTTYILDTSSAWSVLIWGDQLGTKKTDKIYVWPVRGGQSGAVNLPKTGQTTCYDTQGTSVQCIGTGHDGELQAGAIWPNPRFIDNSLADTTNKTVNDNLTGLIWSKDGNLHAATTGWKEALEYITSLNGINYLGHNDWRLPNINEIASLVNKGQSNSATWLNGQGFSNVQMLKYWSSSSFVYTFEKWSVDMSVGNISSYSGGYVWPVRGGQSTAALSATKSGTGTGTVTSSTGGINCGSTCSASITTGTSVIITATPDSGSTFTGWTGACSGIGACIVTMDAAKNVTATFILDATNGSCGSSNGVTFTSAPTTNFCTTGTATAITGTGPWNWTCTGSNGGTTATCTANIQTWTINTGFGSNGTVSCTTPVNNGATSTCTVLPASGYQLATFTDNSVDKTGAVTSGGYSLTGISANHAIAATFSLIPPTPVNGACGSSNTGTFSIVPTTNFCTTGTATAITGTGPWGWACTGSNGGTTATCNASIQTYTISANVTGGNGTASCKSPVNSGATSTCTVSPASGYQITTFTDNSIDKTGAVTGGSYSITGILANHAIAATFSLIPPTPVSGSCGSSNNGTFTIVPTANFCTTGTATAVTGTGPWSWTCAGSNGGTTATCNASIQTYTISINVTGGNGTVSCTSPVNSAATSTCTVTPANGYQVATFTDNSVDKTGAVTGGGYSITGISANHTIAATFSLIPPTPVSGACGASNNGTFTIVPTTNFCTTGTATAVTGIGPWSWTCDGSNGGTTATCSASKSNTPPATFTVTPTTGTGFTITPATPQTVTNNSTTLFTITPASGYGISAVTGCNGNMNSTSYTTGAITANCTVGVTAVARNAGGGGSAQPPTIADALKVLQAIVGITPLTASEQIRYDVAPLGSSGMPVGNGAIDAADVILILRRSIGIGSW